MSSSNDTQQFATDAVLLSLLRGQSEKGPTLRPLHPKSHGLLKGKFKVTNDIPAHCKVGVFARAREYDIWVRFSNGSAPKALNQFQPDSVGDARGMAIKLHHVKGKRAESDESDTQDFTLVNHPVFFLRDVQGYMEFGQLEKAPTPELLKKFEPTQAVLTALNSKKVGNPLKIQYWSTTPYRLGCYGIKFAIKPHQLEVPPADVSQFSENYLREAMVQELTIAKHTFSFDFLVQYFVDEEQTPIENPMQEWPETVAPMIKLATITIPPQEFDFPARKQLDESLSFTPWHTLMQHQPLGNINLARRKIYQEGAKARRARQRQP